jgi:galactokinase/mevalonate kinase-like predicted kinase
MKPRVVEASVPCRVDLGGGGASGPRVAVAIDRRVSCRIEPGVEGAESPGLAGHVRRAVGLEGSARVTTETRALEGSGLGDEVALAVALTGAVAAALGRELSPEAIVRLAGEAARGAGVAVDPAGAGAAVRGGVVSAEDRAEGVRVEALPVDPARIEECLTLVDTGPGVAVPLPAGASRDVRAALVDGRFEDVIDLWAEEWATGERLGPGWPSPEAGRLASLVRAAGGGARLCGAGHGRVLAIWAPPGARGPGRREAVQAALRSAGVRLFAARVDLRGLEVE